MQLRWLAPFAKRLDKRGLPAISRGVRKLFNAEAYLASNPDVRAAGVDPLTHYLEHGAAEGRDAPSGFNPEAISKQRNGEAIANHIRSYVSKPDMLPVFSVRVSNAVAALFDAGAYFEANPDLKARGADPLQHYLESGIIEGRDAPPGFTTEAIAATGAGEQILELLQSRRLRRVRVQYQASQPAGLRSTVDALSTIMSSRIPANIAMIFDKSAYLATNPDVKAAGMEPLQHYLDHGISEGRSPPPGFNSEILRLHKMEDPGAIKIRAAQLHALPKGLGTITLDNDVLKENLGVDYPLPVGEIIAAGIVLYNNEVDEIRRLIGSIQRSRGIEQVTVRVIVINNGVELPPDMEELLAVNNVFILENKDGNLGSSAGHTRLMNYAFNEMGCIAYMTLNPDGFFHPRALERMLRMANRHGWTAAIEAAQLPNENSKYFDPHTFDTEWAVTACALFPRKVWEKAGTFDLNIFLYCDDVDYGWVIRRAGFSVKYCPYAYYFHDYASRTAVSSFFRQNSLEAGRYLAHKWGNPRFRKRCEDRLLEGGFYCSVEDMPKIDHLPTLSSHLDAANFDNEFLFAQSRW